MAVGTLSTRITSQLQSLQGLHLRLRDIGTYLQKVLDGDLPVNHAILGNLQDVFNLLPNLTTPKPVPAATADNGAAVPAVGDSDLARAMSVKTNDQLMTIYLSSLIRAITAFHDLIENKIQNKQQQEDKENGGAKKEGTEKQANGSAANGGSNAAANGESKDAKGGDKGKDKAPEKKK